MRPNFLKNIVAATEFPDDRISCDTGPSSSNVTSSTSSMAASLASWIPRPASFNASKHGSYIKLSEKCSVAERVKPEFPFGSYNNAIVYTAQPVPVGEVWRITVLCTTHGWGGGLVSELLVSIWSPDDTGTRLYM